MCFSLCSSFALLFVMLDESYKHRRITQIPKLRVYEFGCENGVHVNFSPTSQTLSTFRRAIRFNVPHQRHFVGRKIVDSDIVDSERCDTLHLHCVSLFTWRCIWFMADKKVVCAGDWQQRTHVCHCNDAVHAREQWMNSDGCGDREHSFVHRAPRENITPLCRWRCVNVYAHISL